MRRREHFTASYKGKMKASSTGRSKFKLRSVGLIVSGLVVTSLFMAISVTLLALRTPPPPFVKVDPLSAQRLNEDFRQAALSLQKGAQPIVQADETEVNSKLYEFLQRYRAIQKEGTGGSLNDLRIKLHGDLVEAYILLKYRDREVALELTGRIHVSDGYLQFEPDSGKIGALPIPQSRLRAAANQVLNAPTSRQRYLLPDNIADVRVENSKIIFVMK
jgi:hypothetical protein